MSSTSLEWIKHRLIGTPLQGPLESARDLLSYAKSRRHPDLRHIFQEGRTARAVLSRCVRPGMNCLDVGCHLGSVLSEFVRLAPGGAHYAVEPLPHKAAWLRKRYPRATIVEAAITEEEGEIKFSWNRSRSGFSSIASDRPGDDQIERVTVRTCPLDSVVPETVPVGFLKVDTEGAELMAFRSAERILTRDRPPVLFECARRSTLAMGFEVEDVFKTLTERYGYEVMYLDGFLENGSPLTLDEFTGAMVYPFRAFNFMAVPPA